MDLKVRTLVGLFFFVALMLFSASSYSQPTPPCPQQPCPPTPISGIEILIAGGAFWGMRKLIKSKKSKV